MSKSLLPEIIDPLDLIEKNRILDGCLPLVRMERLAGLVLDRAGDVHFRVEFGREGAVRSVSGSVSAEVGLVCQSCLGVMSYDIQREFLLGVVASVDEANRLPEPFEPLLLEKEPLVRLLDLIEDEILLALPDVPKHAVCEDLPLPVRAEIEGTRFLGKSFSGLASLIPRDTTKG